MRQPFPGDGVAQRLDHRVLADQFGKARRTIFAREDSIGLGLAVAHPVTLSAGKDRSRARWQEVGAGTTRSKTRYGCFLPDLTGLARTSPARLPQRSEEHTSELQSLMRISYAVFCLKKKKSTNNHEETVQMDTYRNTKQTTK